MHEQPTYRPTMTVDAHCRSEWQRLAVDAYRNGRNALGHTFSAAAAWPTGEPMPLRKYDDLQTVYRAWLVFGWAGVDDPRIDAARKCLRPSTVY